MTRSAVALLLVAAAGLTAAPAQARHVRYRPLHGPVSAPDRIGVMRDVLLTNQFGDVILDGTTGYHRSDWGVMVPDSEPPSFVATGRASGSGLGANGLPGRNWQDPQVTGRP